MVSNTSHFRHSLIYGGIAGGIIFFVLILGFTFGSATSQNLFLFVGLLFITGMIISTRHYRDMQPDRIISYGNAFVTAFLTALVMGFIWAIYGYILYESAPSLLEAVRNEQQELMLSMGVPEDMVKIMVRQFSPLSMAFSYFFNSAFYGALISLVIAAVLHRRPNPLLTSNDQR